MWTPQVPRTLIDAALDGSLALVFGRDANLGAAWESPAEALPTDNGLRDLLRGEFFDFDSQFESLGSLVRRVVDAHGIAVLQDWMLEIERAYTPNGASRSLPYFDWRGLCALGWDTSIETAYRLAARPLAPADGPIGGAGCASLIRPLNWVDESGYPQWLTSDGDIRFAADDSTSGAEFLRLMHGPVALFGVRSDHPQFSAYLADRSSIGPVFVSSSEPDGAWPDGITVHNALFSDVMTAMNQQRPRARAVVSTGAQSAPSASMSN